MVTGASFSDDTGIVKSVLLKDYLLDDLSSCSSNGFQSYPRRQCCTKVRYLIEIDLHTKSKSKSKYSPILHKASNAVVNVIKSFRFSRSRSSSANPGNPSRKLSSHGFWNRTNEIDKTVEQKKNIIPPVSKVSASVTINTVTKTSTSCYSNSNSYSSASSDSYFTAASNSSSSGDSSKMNSVNLNSVKEIEQLAMEKMNTATTTPDNAKEIEQLAMEKMNTATTTPDNAKEIEQLAMEKMNTATTTPDNAKEIEQIAMEKMNAATTTPDNAKKTLEGEEKDHFSPISVMDFPCNTDNDDEDEVTSPFQHSPLYAQGSKQKHMSKVKRTKSVTQLNPIRLEDRIALSEPRTNASIPKSSLQTQWEFTLEENQTEKKAIALLQLLKATMSTYDLSQFAMIDSVLLGFFTERFIEGNVSNYTILQEGKDWINGQTKEMFESQKNKLTYVREKKEVLKLWKYEKEEELREVVLELEYEVFTSLVEEMLLKY